MAALAYLKRASPTAENRQSSLVGQAQHHGENRSRTGVVLRRGLTRRTSPTFRVKPRFPSSGTTALRRFISAEDFLLVDESLPMFSTCRVTVSLESTCGGAGACFSWTERRKHGWCVWLRSSAYAVERAVLWWEGTLAGLSQSACVQLGRSLDLLLGSQCLPISCWLVWRRSDAIGYCIAFRVYAATGSCCGRRLRVMQTPWL